jgi:hypothetical protein
LVVVVVVVVMVVVVACRDVFSPVDVELFLPGAMPCVSCRRTRTQSPQNSLLSSSRVLVFSIVVVVMIVVCSRPKTRRIRQARVTTGRPLRWTT